MDELSQAKLSKITDKHVENLTQDEILFLRARRSYLSKAMEEDFAEVLSDEWKPEPEEKTVDPNRIPYKELQKKAKFHGLPYTGVSREDLEVAIATAEGPASAPKPN